MCVTPVPKSRPRFSQGRVYTPKKTKDYERAVQLFAQRAMAGKKPFAGGVEVHLGFWCFRPNRTRYSFPPRPDLDNLVKAVLDGLNGIAFKAESIIWQVIAEKQYSTDGIPCVSVEVKPYEGE